MMTYHTTNEFGGKDSIHAICQGCLSLTMMVSSRCELLLSGKTRFQDARLTNGEVWFGSQFIAGLPAFLRSARVKQSAGERTWEGIMTCHAQGASEEWQRRKIDMHDYQPLNLDQFCNVGAEFIRDGAEPQIGIQTWHGLP